MSLQAGEYVREKIGGRVLFTRELGIGRTFLAAATFGALLANPPYLLFRDPNPITHGPVCTGIVRASIFCAFGARNMAFGRTIALMILLIVAYGWRPRITSIPHWWVTWSFFIATAPFDGGDQAAVVLTLFLIPIGLLDARRWHWTDTPPRPPEAIGATDVIAAATLVAIQVQVAVIYMQAGIAKFGQFTWANGTAAYYWILNPRFGTVHAFHGIMHAVLTNGLGTAAMSYSVIVIEVATGFAFLARGRLRKGIFWSAVALHAAIAVLLGLPSFGLAMTGALILYFWANDGIAGVGRAPRPAGPAQSSAPRRERVLVYQRARRDSNPQPPGP